MGVNKVTVKKADVDLKGLMTALSLPFDAKVGYPEETTGSREHVDSGLPIAELASFAELGTETSPPRRFMTQGADVLVQRRGLMVPHVKRLASGKYHVGAFLRAAGLLLKGSIEEAVARQDFPPLAQATIAAKGSSEILVDTGEMVESLDVVVRTF